MRILLAHNRYRHVGGEDAAFDAERRLLESRGHEVSCYERDNREIRSGFAAAVSALWAADSARDLRRLIAERRPQLAHFTNTFPLISPSAYYACREAGIPVLQNVQNYRLICPSAVLRRDGRICEDCVGRRVAWPGVVHRCYRGSLPASASVAALLALHHALRSWDLVDLFVTPTRFLRDQLVKGGFAAGRIAVKPNFLLDDPGPGRTREPFALYAGRLSDEKGVETLLEAWRKLPGVPLKLAGTGPRLAWLQQQARENPDVEVLGFRPRDEVLRLMQRARLLVVPSEWYEGMPLTIVEALACALPVLAARIGGLPEVLGESGAGRLFEAGSADDLRAQVDALWRDPAEQERMGRAARALFLAEYTPDRNYRLLTDLYARVLDVNAH